MVSICGNTLTTDELVQSTTTSAFADLQRLGGVARHFHAEPLPQSDDVAEVATRLRRVDVDGADNLETRARRRLLDDGRADGTESEVQHANVGHNLRIIPSIKRAPV